jgi:hypothetical protein
MIGSKNKNKQRLLDTEQRTQRIEKEINQSIHGLNNDVIMIFILCG